MNYQDLTKELVQNAGILTRFLNHSRGIHASRGRAFVLQYLMHTEEAFSSDICTKMGVTTARMASVLNGLEEKGLIERRIDAQDRRKVIVSITEEGRKTAISDQQWVMQQMQKVLEQLGDEDALAFVRITGRLVRIMQNAHSNCQ